MNTTHPGSSSRKTPRLSSDKLKIWVSATVYTTPSVTHLFRIQIPLLELPFLRNMRSTDLELYWATMTFTLESCELLPDSNSECSTSDPAVTNLSGNSIATVGTNTLTRRLPSGLITRNSL